MTDAPSQLQEGIGGLISGIAGGYSHERDQQNQMAMQNAYADAMFQGRQGLQDDLLKSKKAIDDANNATRIKQAQILADAKKAAAAGKGPGAKVLPGFDVGKYLAGATKIASQAVGFDPKDPLALKNITPEQAASYNTSLKDQWNNSALAYNQRLPSGTDPSHFAPEDPGEYLTVSKPAVPGWFSDTPPVYSVNGGFGYGKDGGGNSKGGALTFAQRAAKQAALLNQQNTPPATQ